MRWLAASMGVRLLSSAPVPALSALPVWLTKREMESNGASASAASAASLPCAVLLCSAH